VKRAALSTFRRLPMPVRRAVIHTAMPCYTVGAVAVLRRPDGHLVLVEQRHSVGWALPGGLLSRGEPAAQALVRELAEELGVRLTPADLPVPLAAVNPIARRVDVVYFIDIPDSVVLRTEDRAEVTRTGWFRLDALPEIGDPTREILQAVRLL